MQLKGLVRFFTIILILVSVYMLSFTWFVRGHEKKLKTRAEKTVLASYPEMRNVDPEDYSDSARKLYDDRMRRLEDSTKDVVLSYDFTGAVTYQEAKNYELNLGLDLQGGMNVTLEVEMTELLHKMANNSTDPSFLKALDNANKKKANSGANFITLFYDEYRAINPNGRLASLFATSGQDKIKITDDNATVINAIRKEAKDAFDRTYNILRTRIDQFGVAQPNINRNDDRGIIDVELPGIRDKDRVRDYLQSTANLQFWEVYKINEIAGAFTAANEAFDAYMKGTDSTSKTDTTKKIDSSTVAKATTKDTANQTLSGIDTNAKSTQTNNTAAAAGRKRMLTEFIKPTSAATGFFGTVDSKDTAAVREYLQAPQLRKFFPPDVLFLYGKPEGKMSSKQVPVYAIKTNGKQKAPIEGEVITDASQGYQQNTNKPNVSMKMNSTGSRLWEKLTETSNKETRPIAVVLDDVVYSAPIAYNGKISGGNTEISGNFTLQEAQDLAKILKAGKLPARAKIVAEQVVGPTLGKDAINGGLMAFVISFIVIFALMLIYYNTSGWVANIALILNLLFTIGVLTALGATLTAPGIAGLVLTIGMAVDTNVIIYERIKEELTKGKGYIPAVNEGYRRSLPPVLDAHVTTLLTAIILFYFGLGPVKGFATTQILGILLSLFCGILVSRWVTEWFTNKKRHLEYFTGISRRIFKHANFKFIEYRKVAYGISVVVLCLGIGSIFHGFDEGVEFKGGRSYQVRFDDKMSSDKIENVRRDLEKVFAETPVIKTVGDNKTLDITTSYLINETSPKTDSIVETTLFGGLTPFFQKKMTYSQFDNGYANVGKVGSKKVLPTISDDIKNGAKRATIFALLIIAFYIFIRFRDWRYSVGTIIALLHDVLVTLAVFSFCKDLNLPFPLEIDQHFIAAILTVIGFSMNDTVIVFDRIREYSKLMPTAPKETVINRAINDTLSRTIMTSLTVFLTILILFIVGGEVTKGFAFAMLIGVITGTYSSVFVAAPVLVDLARKKPLGKSEAVTEAKPKTSTAPVKTSA